MPILEYRCTECGDFEHIHLSLKENKLKKCPKCGKKVSTLMSASNAHFIGTGWYKTDYATKNKKPNKSK